MSDKKLEIVLDEYSYECGDGCCHEWGMKVSVNGVAMPYKNTDTETILKQILEHLGYQVEITSKFNGE